MRAEYGVPVTRPKMAIDFHAVEEKHWGIHARLENWARWCNPKQSGKVQPMFRLYRSSDARREYGSTAGMHIDILDAQKVAKGVAALPEKHCASLVWCYGKPISPRRKAIELGLTMQGLMLHVRDARQMLLNLGV